MIDMGGAKPTDRVRLRWRSRRGLLENDLIITRFLDAHEASLTENDVVALSQLLDLTDTDLLDYILRKKELPAEDYDAAARAMLDRLRQA
jgi:antitoxin CptB